ncbi:MAG: Lrp/AsnC family leucine-responsive transcriptional regulator [Candidatus Paceibacteria bacterium]|jgi:Lrp/AsnC family leucine-responsive transcriptional regulator
MPRTIDQVDLQILKLVQSDARLANAEVARNLGMAPSAIHQRLKRLEERGVIRGYSARVDPGSVDRGLLSFIHVSTDEALGKFDVAAAIAKLPGVLEVHDIAGEDCYLLKVRAADTSHLHQFLREELGAIPGVRSTRTTIVLKTISERVDLPIPSSLETES